MVGSYIRRFDQHCPQVSSTRFRDLPATAGHAARMYACSQSSIAHQFLGFCKALDISDGSPDRHRCHHAKACQVQQASDLLLLRSHPFHDLCHVFDLLLCELQRFQVTLQIELFQFPERQRLPPLLVVRSKRIACGRNQVVALQHGMQSVLRLRDQSHHFLSLGHQSARFPDLLRRDPDPDQQAFG